MPGSGRITQTRNNAFRGLCGSREQSQSRWNGVQLESMKKQLRILLRCAPQDDSAVVVAIAIFRTDPLQLRSGQAFDCGWRGDLRPG